jgi:hypothetical protein
MVALLVASGRSCVPTAGPASTQIQLSGGGVTMSKTFIGRETDFAADEKPVNS